MHYEIITANVIGEIAQRHYLFENRIDPHQYFFIEFILLRFIRVFSSSIFSKSI